MKRTALLMGLVAATAVQTTWSNSIIDDAQVNLTARNFYFDRDYKGESAYPAARDWAQGFILKANSGYTEGVVGFGVDVLGLAAFNLGHNSEDYAASGLLPVGTNNERIDSSAEIRLTAKAKIQDSTLHVGTLTPMFPVLFSSPARLLQQHYRGAHLQFNEIDQLKLHAIYVDRVNQRDSTDYETIRVGNPNGRFAAAAASSGLHMLGGDYKINDTATFQLYHANLHDVYYQSFAGLKSKHDVGFATALSDLRLFVSEDEGEARAGHIDNQHFSGIVGLNRNNHTVSVGYMQSFGDTAMPTLASAEPAVFLDSMSADFSNKDEKVYHVRYDYDFKDVGLNGLKFMTRYSKGVDIDLPQFGDKDFSQSSLDFDVSYRVPTGKLEGLNLRTRFSRYRNDMPVTGMAFRSDNETRVNIDYTWKFK